ncbi:hypothetical protein H2203_005173 [Taxawa tesnikishii (nom. ined.)]|nr:hypothetical protein H2203_005173 [Dothideales sp. JES 119]
MEGTELCDVLWRLGLSQYFRAFIDEGFDILPTLMDITESDLDALGVKLGHRRKLQRFIAESRTKDGKYMPLEVLQANNSTDETACSGDGGTSTNKVQQSDVQNAGSDQAQPGAKRKYRRHPKPDEFAPERPPSAYVIFSNLMREKLRGQELSFTEIAKIVGECWQESSQSEKEPCEKEAQSLKEKYYANLAEYKKTLQYARYQEYVVEFRAKHNPDGGKRTKFDMENRSTRGNSQDYSDRASSRHQEPHWSYGRADGEQDLSTSPVGRHQLLPNASNPASPRNSGSQVRSPLNRKMSTSPNLPIIAPFRPYLHLVDHGVQMEE